MFLIRFVIAIAILIPWKLWASAPHPVQTAIIVLLAFGSGRLVEFWIANRQAIDPALRKPLLQRSTIVVAAVAIAVVGAIVLGYRWTEHMVEQDSESRVIGERW